MTANWFNRADPFSHSDGDCIRSRPSKWGVRRLPGTKGHFNLDSKLTEKVIEIEEVELMPLSKSPY